MFSELDFILKDIKTITCFNHDKYYLKHELDAFLFPKSTRPYCDYNVFNSICQQTDEQKCRTIYSRKIDFIFLRIEASTLFEPNYAHEFNYFLWDYCEKRMQRKTWDRHIIYICVGNVHRKLRHAYESFDYDTDKRSFKDIQKNIYIENVEWYILKELFLYKWEHNKTISLSRLKKIVKNACENRLKYMDNDYDKEYLVAYSELLEKEIDYIWESKVEMDLISYF